MGLKKYSSKRNLKKSSEPKAKIKNSSSGPLHFCVQKHDARRLHYDFRLEYKGVLLSWAVPKGPSLDPKDKRLAIKVEDHPLEYQYFEGIIPKGNYGAGTVEIWDHGSFQAMGATTRQESEECLTKGLKKGHFSIILEGDKLNGEFTFQKLKSDPDDNAWLLIKKGEKGSEVSQKTVKEKTKKQEKLPDFIPPMLATLVDKPFDDEDWLFEIKWDGFRGLGFINKGKVELKSRSKILLNKKFPSIVKELEKIPGQVILDGELVVVDAQGKPQFQLMQNYQGKGEGTLCYYVFDILYKDGEDLRELPLIERKKLLKKLLKELNLPSIRFSDHVVKEGVAFFNEVSKEHLEGMIAKNMGSTYQSKRSADWVKVKTSCRQEVVIGGFTAPRGSRQKFGALLVGVYNDKNEFCYVGHVGGGFNAALLEDCYKQLKPLIQNKCAFIKEPKGNEAVTWVKPKLICEVSFAEWTKGNIMRQPIFHGMRSDKKAKAVKKEEALELPKEKKSRKKSSSAGVVLTHLDKIYWPQEKYTKGDLIKYYEQVAPFILPYLKNRPIMLHRFPNGIEGKDFYQKDIEMLHAETLKICPVEHEGKVVHYLLIDDLQSLLYAVNLGSIDLHPFISSCSSLENPDFCVIDLDPHDISFQEVVKVALAFHEILDQIKVKHVCKTSGGKGLHILIPLQKKYTFEQSRQFAEVIAHLVHEKFPAITSMERSPAKRPKKIYLDCLQNRTRQSIAAPYSVRPRPLATVSTPLEWKEVNNKLDPKKFTLKTVPSRLKKKGDLLKDLFKNGANLKTALEKLKKLTDF